MELTDETLIAGIKRDDYSSYNQLFMRYYSRLCAFVLNLTQNYSASEDVVQELFIRLWIQRGKLEITENISGYLYKSSKNAALNYLRAEKSRQKSIQNMHVQEWHTDENLIEQIEFSAALNQCIGQLPERSRDVFMKSRFDGLKQQEISDQLGISVKTIKNQIWKSLQFLKACLELHDAFEH
ncbi:MAG: RNA polymerase sigma-70 factor [Prolixibacteraceae bacterium]|nr:RNA polymerase sigma-70 factor [Prolixibacteraceae bacterium]